MLYVLDMEGVRRPIGDIRPQEDRWLVEVTAPDGRLLYSEEVHSPGYAKLCAERYVRSAGGLMPESFPNWVRRRRTELGFSLARLARMAQLDHTTVRSVELALYQPQEKTISSLRAVLEEDLDLAPAMGLSGLEARVARLEAVIDKLGRALSP